MLSPRWASDPLSGAGAARHGGRFNAPGRKALYVSADFVTAVAEYEQELGIRPGVLCAYDVDVRGIVDLTSLDVRTRLSVDEVVLRIPWKHLALVEQRRPPTWRLTERLASLGAAGIRVPSTRSPGSNLVLFRWNEPEVGSVRVLDPLNELPRTRRSPR
jgi:RES domain-containing protein